MYVLKPSIGVSSSSGVPRPLAIGPSNSFVVTCGVADPRLHVETLYNNCPPAMLHAERDHVSYQVRL